MQLPGAILSRSSQTERAYEQCQTIAPDFEPCFLLESIDNLGRVGGLATVAVQQNIEPLGIQVLLTLEGFGEASKQDTLAARQATMSNLTSSWRSILQRLRCLHDLHQTPRSTATMKASSASRASRDLVT